MKKLPNFLIVGAAKSGTTSLYNYLKQHPEIYMNEELKESRFFSYYDYVGPSLDAGPGDALEDRFPKQLEEYQLLFKDAKEKFLGEASPDYLYFHNRTVPQIKKVLGDTKIIIILRNPIERAFSNYMHLIRDGRETMSFKDALIEENKRIQDNYWFIWCYKHAGLYYEQVNHFIENFTDVKVVLFDDLKENKSELLSDLFEFIGVDNTFEPDTSKIHNPSGRPKNKLLNYFLKRENVIKSSLMFILKKLGLKTVSKKIFENIRNKNNVNLVKEQINQSDREFLIEYFKADILELEKLLDRDLSHWHRK